MRSARLVLALTGAGGRRAAPTRAFLLQPCAWRPLSSAVGKPPHNPFEIDLNPLKTPVSTTDKLTLGDAKRAAATQQTDAQHEINVLHDEMSRLFGEQVAEHGGDRSSSSVEEAVSTFKNFKNGAEAGEQGVTLSREARDRAIAAAAAVQREQPPVLATKADVKPKKKQISSGEKSVSEEKSSYNPPVDVLLLQGPCSFVQGVWTGGNVEKEELRNQIQALAEDLKIVVKGRSYDSEKMILEKLLEAREDQVVVLCWNSKFEQSCLKSHLLACLLSLGKSPFIIHALELIQSSVIIVSPSNVEHGPLPANVVGVLSGFWDQSLSLALNATANLRANDRKKLTPRGASNTENLQSLAGSASAKKGEASSTKGKKKVFTCYLCGKEGHIRSKCPELPRNKA